MQIVTDDAVNAALDYNEAKIRFQIIDPIVRRLGYPDEDNVYLELEEKLEYPYVHIGRRSKKDLPVGFPDYRAGLKGARGSFIIEAKAGSAPITSREVEQAHSYAAHAQVGANYFLLCNGNVIAVYETLSGPNPAPIVEIPLKEVNHRFHELENILSPKNLARNCHVTHDTKLKLAEGLLSSSSIRSGRYLLADYDYRMVMNGQDCTAFITESVPQIAIMNQQLELLKTAFELRVSGGVAERDADGHITAHVEFTGATVHNHQAMKIMGITELTFATADKFISTDPSSPTIFESVKDFTVSRGTMFPQLFGGSLPVESDISGDMFVKAAMHYEEGKVLGQYVAFSGQQIPISGSPPLEIEMDIAGTFELTLDD